MNGLYKKICHRDSKSLWLKVFLNFIGHSNLFLALATFCFTWQGSFIFTSEKETFYLFAINNFCAAFSLYTIQRTFQSFHQTNDERLLWYRKNRKNLLFLWIIIMIIFSPTLFKILFYYTQSIYGYILLGIISILYFLPPFEFRKIAYLKIFYISFVWVMVCIAIPLLFEDKTYTGFSNFTNKEWYYIVSQFIFLSAICIPFDIRDIKKDIADNVGTIPIRIGIRNSKILSGVFLTIYVFLSIFIKTGNLIFSNGITFFASILVLFYSKPTTNRYFFIYFADGLIVLQAVLVYTFVK